MRRTTAGVLALLLAGVLGGAPAAEDATGWRPLPVRAGPQRDLLDCRSLTVRHEVRVRLDQPFAAQGRTLRFREEARAAVAVEDGPSEGDGAPTRTVLSALPALLRLEGRSAAGALAVRRDPAGGAVWVASGFGVPIPVGRSKGLLVDSDLDGDLGGAGDGWVAPECRTVAPWCGEVWSREGGLLVRRTAAGGWEASAIPPPHPEDRDHAAAWSLVQWRRQQCGLLPLGYDPTLEEAIRSHAVYCVANGYHGHDEVPGGKGYTPEGAAAGRASVLGWDHESALVGMDEQLATLYHRNQVLSPALTKSAFVLHLGVFGMDVRHHAGGPLALSPLVFPPHGMEGARARFSEHGESPMPVGWLVYANRFGVPVSVSGAPLERTVSLPTKPEIELVVLDRKGRSGGRVRAEVHFPGRAPDTGIGPPNGGAVALTPAEPLQPGTRYRARVAAALPGLEWPGRDGEVLVHEWEFTVAR